MPPERLFYWILLILLLVLLFILVLSVADLRID
jgi:hypothetical protein